jgi:hypothetical protein
MRFALLFISVPLTLFMCLMSWIGVESFGDPTEHRYAVYLLVYCGIFAVFWIFNIFVPRLIWFHVVGLLGLLGLLGYQIISVQRFH